MLDPEAPLVWDRLRCMPDGLPGLLAATGSSPLVPRASVVSLLGSEALILRAMDEAPGPRRELAIAAARRAMAVTRSEAAMLKLTYELNPSMSCASPMLARHPVAGLATLLPSLERVCEGSGDASILDQHLMAFISVRRTAAGLKSVRSNDALAELRLIASLSTDFRTAGLPNLTRRLASPVLAGLQQWPGMSRRNVRRAALEQAIADGDPAALLAVAADQEALARETTAQAEAHERIKTLEVLRDKLATAGEEREAIALRFGREGVAVVGAAACAVALLMQMLS